MKLFLLLLVALFYIAQCISTDKEIAGQWRAFKAEYGKNYGKDKDPKFRGLSEEVFRRRVFFNKALRIKKHNEKYKEGLESYEMGINRFTDMTEEEMRPFTHGVVEPSVLPEATINITSARSIPGWGKRKRQKIPWSKDWRKYNVVTHVRDQGHCGSCWAFAAASALESRFKKILGPNYDIRVSEQELIDCVPRTNGCKGGSVDAVFDYVKKKGVSRNSILFEVFLRYYGKKFKTCSRNLRNKPPVKIKGFARLAKPRDERLLVNFVATSGPVTAYIDASGKFRSYKNGVYYNPKCSSKKLSHAVLIVGYGREKGKDYWIVKNSWGQKWGDKGYIKMARNKNNNCGIATYIRIPLLIGY